MSASPRYHSLAIILHWGMALAILLMLASGITMEYVPVEKTLRMDLFYWHKSLGFMVLVLVLVRVGVRLWTRPPGWSALPAWAVRLAKLTHNGLYVLMTALPLSGWLLVSGRVGVEATSVFGWFDWPHIPGVAGVEALHELAEETHWWLALAMLLLVTLHIAGVVKHAKDGTGNLLPRMWWSRR